MQNALILLDALGYIQDVYITDAHKKTKKHTTVRKKIILIAAVIATLLLLAGCTAYIWNWYTIYFAQKKQAPLTDGQISYIQNNTVEYRACQTYDEYTVELKSTISESHTTYVTFGISAPDNIDFSPFLDINSQEQLSFQDIYAWTVDSTVPLNLSYEPADDCDEKNNTFNMVVKIKHTLPMGSESVCRIEFKGLVRQGYDQAYEQELKSTKYAGQSDYMLDSEEAARVHPQILLASGTWAFEVNLNGNDGMVEILDEPISVKALVVRVGEQEYEIVDSIEVVTLSSICLDPLGASISFKKPDPIDKFDCIYLHIDQFTAKTEMNQGEEIYLKMKDGSRIDLFQEDGGKETIYMEADCPVDLINAECLHLSDGTEIRIP